MQYEKCGKKNFSAKASRQKATTKLHQLDYSEESSSNKSTYIIKEKIANAETRKKWYVAPILMKLKSNKPVVECQVNSGASCNVISHSLKCKLFQERYHKLQEQTSRK